MTPLRKNSKALGIIQKFSLFPYKFDLNLKLKLEDVYPAFVKALIGEKRNELHFLKKKVLFYKKKTNKDVYYAIIDLLYVPT